MAVKDRKLKKYERLANSSPSAPQLEYQFLATLNEAGHHDAVAHRYETTPRHHQNPEVTLEYLRAMQQLGRTPSIVQQSGGALAGGVVGKAEAQHELMSHAAAMQRQGPLDVRVVQGWQGKASSGAWTTVRWGIVAFLVVSMIGTLVDTQGGGGGAAGRMGVNSTVHVAESSEKRFSDVMGCDEAKSELEEVSVLQLNHVARVVLSLPSGA